jgi:hypothetical protein
MVAILTGETFLRIDEIEGISGHEAAIIVHL